MGLNYNFSDYGSGSSSSSSSWASQQDIRWSSFAAKPTMDHSTQKASSYSDLMKGRCTLDDVMREFHMNGSDAPYNPDEDRIWGNYSVPDVSAGTSSYMRQKSWPAPERSPAPRLPKPERMEFATSTPVFNEFPPAPFAPPAPSPPAAPAPPALSSEQQRVLRALPADVLHALLRQLQIEKRTRVYQECRFCKNNGERESYYRSHVLKDARGRVACPVLRAFTCARCGARGDAAHTIKYCPLSTNEERIKSTAMMRSVRMASGRRRGAGPPSAGAGADYVVFGEAPPSVLQDNTAFSFHEAPLDPLWAALEQKLML